jgi:IS605 OrfB family transposase
MPAKATKTIKQALSYKPQHAIWFAKTQALFNRIAGFYFEVIAAHPGILDLSNMEALGALEKLTHATAEHPNPIMPLAEVAPDVPAMLRRAAINAALGSAKSFYTSLSKWRTRKEQAEAKGKKYTVRPPVPPRNWNRSTTFYAGMRNDCQGSSVLLKLWTGTSFAWVKVGVCGRDLPNGWEQNSPQLVRHGSHWWLHIPVERKMEHPRKVETQITAVPDTKICAVDLNINEHLAVCTIQTVEGTVVATRFIGGGKRLHDLRKRQLGRIARNRSKTGIIAEGEQDNVHLWAKVRAIDEDTAHQISHRIVEFAVAYGAGILVFEHLANFKPEKGKYSRRANSKRSYWLRGRIFKYTKYKAWNEGIVTSRVNPRNTSRECARCGASVARYNAGQPAEGYTPGTPLVFCSNCQMRGHSDRNASIVIGKRLLARYQQTHLKEKTHALLRRAGRYAKAGGDIGSQEVKRSRRPSTHAPRHGTDTAFGTTQGGPSGMVDGASPIPAQLRLFSE